LGVTGSAWRWFQSYLEGRSYQVSKHISACLTDIASWTTAQYLKLNPSKTQLLYIPDFSFVTYEGFDSFSRRKLPRKMAEARVSEDQDQFSCPVCLDLLKDPVAIPCGHSFCMVCINDFWDQEDQRGIYSCPQCRETFTPRPVLRRNYMLAKALQKLKKTELQAASPIHCYAEPGDVECDSCTERKHKAIKSCLVCLASFCETHIRPHYQSLAFKKHTLVKVISRLQEKICSQHDKVTEIFCRTDQSFICHLCTMYEHKGHDTVSV
ncbi:hypothetical protein P4O66_019900, partial [Electrophorus voltai]